MVYKKRRRSIEHTGEPGPLQEARSEFIENLAAEDDQGEEMGGQLCLLTRLRLGAQGRSHAES
jgi:hypothetical protein